MTFLRRLNFIPINAPYHLSANSSLIRIIIISASFTCNQLSPSLKICIFIIQYNIQTIVPFIHSDHMRDNGG